MPNFNGSIQISELNIKAGNKSIFSFIASKNYITFFQSASFNGIRNFASFKLFGATSNTSSGNNSNIRVTGQIYP